jgi:acetyl/propionyl-CoA carboxylase alpha subunit
VQQGTIISTHYDSLIAKICSFDPINRYNAINKMKRALDELVIQGISHNTPLLRDIFESNSFEKGETSTDFIKDKYGAGFTGRPLSDLAKNNLLAVAASIYLEKLKIKFLNNFPTQCCVYISINSGKYSKIILNQSNNSIYSVRF